MNIDGPPMHDLRVERDFLIRLLALSDHDSPRGLVEEALALVAERAGAHRAYLEIRESPDGGARWSAWSGLERERIEEVKRLLSTTIMADAIASGHSVETVSAADDERFRDAESVRKNQIEAVLCVPIGRPPLGVIYLQGHTAGARFPGEARQMSERFARHLAPLARRLVALAGREALDPTAPHRAKLSGAEVLVGRSVALAEVLRMSAAVAPLDVSILLTGPSGTGKSELARIIARSSRRADKPFVALNCAAIPNELLESELFGAMPGAHSMAKRRMIGKIEAAAGGTLFLDEVGDLSLPSQAKLLQFLQDGTIWPLGATKSSRVDVRIIAATNVELSERTTTKEFREDLFHRLNVVRIALPGLDGRRADIGVLAEAMVAQHRDRHGLTMMSLSLEARHALMAAEWPGHVRQLANTVLAAAVRAQAEGARSIETRHCFPDAEPSQLRTWQALMRDFQRQVLSDALAEAGGSVTAAALRLGIARSYAYELVKELGLRDRAKG